MLCDTHDNRCPTPQAGSARFPSHVSQGRFSHGLWPKKRGPEHLPQGSGPHQVGPHGLHHYLGRLMVQATPKAGDSITELHNVVSRARTTLRLFRLKLIT